MAILLGFFLNHFLQKFLYIFFFLEILFRATFSSHPVTYLNDLYEDINIPLYSKSLYSVEHPRVGESNNHAQFPLSQDTNVNEQINMLTFDDFKAEDTTLTLLPMNISYFEKFLWGKNGLFRKVGLTADLSLEQREKELLWRRNFLNLHQTLGLITWGLMAGTITTGQLWLDGKIDSPLWHKRFLYATIVGYGFTGIMAVITPPPILRRNEFSTVTFHKLAAWLHFAGMLATPIVGKLILSSGDNYYKVAKIHQKLGYFTFSVYTVSMLTIMLFE